MKELIFLYQRKVIARLVQNKICINVFCYENKVVYPVYLLSDQNLVIVWICC